MVVLSYPSTLCFAPSCDQMIEERKTKLREEMKTKIIEELKAKISEELKA